MFLQSFKILYLCDLNFRLLHHMMTSEGKIQLKYALTKMFDEREQLK